MMWRETTGYEWMCSQCDYGFEARAPHTGPAEVLELHHHVFLMRRGWMQVAHGHVDVRMPGEFSESGKINAGHGHAGEGRVAQVVETEVWLNSRPPKGSLMSFAGAALPGATPERRPVPAAGTLALPAQSLCGNYLS